MKINNRLDQNYLKTLTVLYVEDDVDTRKQFTEFLSRPVGTLITAADGAEGLEAFKRHSPDIVITDILMPLMDGLTMSQHILKMAPSVPIIVLTAFEQTDYLMRAISIGIDKYVTKPVNSYLLFESMLECAHRLRAEQQLKLQHHREIREAWSKHNETVAILTAGMAHDYNNLMQTILGYASLAKMSVESGSESSNYLNNIEKCAPQAHELWLMLKVLGNDYVDNTQLGPVMPCILRSIQHALTGRSIDFNSDYPENLPDITFSEEQLQLVFTGLTANALDAMPEGGTLHLSAQVITISEQDSVPIKPGSYLQISLADSGVGIPPEVMAKIFDPYFSTKPRSTKRGMGLDLALCRTIIMGYGGIITAESTPGSGTTIQIRLPIPG